MTETSGTIYDAIERTVRRLEREQVSTFEYKDERAYLRLALGVVPDATPERSMETVKTPVAGIFLSTHPLARGKSETASGSPVRAGQIVGYMQVGPVLRPVAAPRDGVLGRQLVGDDVLTGARQPIFEFCGSKAR
jgi:acetyl-CoA carboxylase biotin carboxyl carrier protein